MEISCRKLKIQVGFKEMWVLSVLMGATDTTGADMTSGEHHLSRKAG